MNPKRKPKPSLKELFEKYEKEMLKPFYTSIALKRGDVQSFDVYPFNIPSIQTLNTLPLHPKVTFFIGENGSGKSTLLEAVAARLEVNPEGGSRHFNFATRPSHSDLKAYLQISRSPNSTRRPADYYFLRAESFYNVATEIEKLGVIKSYGGKSLHEQSHGESFFALMNERFHNDGFYMLDEPEAALSTSRQLAMLTLLHRHIEDGCQFIIATHSPIIMAYPDAMIYSFGPEGIRQINYEETDHFRLTRNFLNRRESMLKVLLSDED